MAGAGIHIQEVYEKTLRHGVLNREVIRRHIKMLKSMPVVVEEDVRRYEAGDIDFHEFLDNMDELLDIIRGLRQEALSWVPEITFNRRGKMEVWEKDFVQEIMEYAGELWQMEKHLSEYIAHLVSSK